MKLKTKTGTATAFALTAVTMLTSATASETAWSCWQRDTDIHCISGSQSPLAAGTPFLRTSHGQNQAGYAGENEWIVIPMYNHPTDWSFVELLVKSVMCGRRTDCTVELNSNPLNTAMLELDG